jgi:hypothetical protein
MKTNAIFSETWEKPVTIRVKFEVKKVMNVLWFNVPSDCIIDAFVDSRH